MYLYLEQGGSSVQRSIIKQKCVLNVSLHSHAHSDHNFRRTLFNLNNKRKYTHTLFSNHNRNLVTNSFVKRQNVYVRSKLPQRIFLFVFLPQIKIKMVCIHLDLCVCFRIWTKREQHKKCSFRTKNCNKLSLSKNAFDYICRLDSQFYNISPN